jgi:hypothetical protein
MLAGETVDDDDVRGVDVLSLKIRDAMRTMEAKGVAPSLFVGSAKHAFS